MGTVISNGIAITHLNPNAGGGGTSIVRIKAIDAATTPAGVTWKRGSETITGTLEASSATKDTIIFVPAPITKNKDLYDEYVVMEDGGVFAWEKLGRSIEIKEHPYLSLERIKEFLYKVTFDTLPQDNGVNSYAAGACSSYVKDGKLHRNFDFNYSNMAEFIVRTKDYEGMSIVPGLDDSALDDAKIAQLPYRPVDGRNNYGIMMSVHLLFNDWQYTGAGTKSIPLTRLSFEVMTRVKSMESIATDLADVLGNLNAEGMGDYLLQLLITDGVTTYALVPPTADGEDYELVDATSYPKMTNFRYVARAEVAREDMDLQTRPTGIERFNMMPCALEDLRFTKCYETSDRLSEFIGIDGTTKASTDAELEAIYTEARAEYLVRERDGKTWQTMHSVVYGDKMEALYIQENFDDNLRPIGGGGSSNNIILCTIEDELAEVLLRWPLLKDEIIATVTAYPSLKEGLIAHSELAPYYASAKAIIDENEGLEDSIEAYPIIAKLVVENEGLAPILVDNTGLDALVAATPTVAPVLVAYPAIAPYCVAYPSIVRSIARWNALVPVLLAETRYIPYLAEDPIIAHSLVNTGLRAWLVGDGTAYINTGLYQLEWPLKVKTNVAYNINSEMYLGGNYSSGSNGSRVGLKSSKHTMYSGSDYQPISTAVVLKQEYAVEFEFAGLTGKKMTVDGAVNENASAANKVGANDLPFGWFSGKGNAVSNILNGRISDADLTIGENTYHYIPAMHDGAYGYLETTTMEFKGNNNTSGQFYVTTTPKE